MKCFLLLLSLAYFCNCSIIDYEVSTPAYEFKSEELPENSSEEEHELCDINVCMNEGMCYVINGYDVCICSPGYKGNLCQIDQDEDQNCEGISVSSLERLSEQSGVNPIEILDRIDRINWASFMQRRMSNHYGMRMPSHREHPMHGRRFHHDMNNGRPCQNGLCPYNKNSGASTDQPEGRQYHHGRRFRMRSGRINRQN